MEEEGEGSRELVVECVDGGFKGFVEVLPSHTLQDLRQLLTDEFDDDMLPAEYYFTCDGVRYSTKQEGRKRLWELLNRKSVVRVHDKNRGLKRSIVPAETNFSSPPTSTTTAELLGEAEETRRDCIGPASRKKKLCLRMDPVDEQSSLSDPATDSPVVASTVASRGGSVRHEGEKISASRRSTATPGTGTKVNSNEEMRLPSSPPTSGRAPSGTKRKGTAHGGGGRFEQGTPPVTSNKTSKMAKMRNVHPSLRKAIPFTLGTRRAQMSRPEEGSTPSSLLDKEGASPQGVTAKSIGSGKKSGATSGTESSSKNLADRFAAAAAEAATESGDGKLAGTVKRPSRRSASSMVVPTGSVVDDDDDTVLDGKEDDDDVVSLVNPTAPANDANDAQRTARDKSCQVLNDLQVLLKDNPLFCSQERRDDFEKEIRERLASTAPRVVVGVLGSTGVGKSSLLNALLDEAAVLPTSGSRGCTAAVVELSFNQELADPPTQAEKIPVYRGKVEFMKPQDWEAELRVLVDECSTHEKHVYTRRPDPDSAPDANAAWAKIDQVYGSGTMDSYRGDPTHVALASLLRNRRVTTLLAPKDGQEYNSVDVEEGAVNIDEATLLLGGFDKLNRRMRRSVKSWAQAFRRKINDYVYRKGNGTDPQTWPLIRCVKLQGPWNVLSTGACLVDLPGVRDANAARARVSERYLQNCSQIWVVAPIKRAVDDGTAKELLGEQFKRRLLMDGQYGNVSFICTQTDDCEATEIMRDHADVAQGKPGRWERMTNLVDKISNVDVELSTLLQLEEDLETKHEEAVAHLNDINDEDSDESDDELSETSEHERRDSLVEEARERVSEALLELKTWRSTNAPKREQLDQKSHRLQRQLKALCAEVRNEYSARCLKDDFIDGLKDLYRDEDGQAESGKKQTMPDNLDLNVFCISANDYLKIQGIKPTSDGPPNCFSTAKETQIPALRAYVHEATATHRTSFFDLFANQVSDIVDRFKLVATDTDSAGSTRLSRKCRSLFDKEMLSLEQKVKAVVQTFRSSAGRGVDSTLQPSLRTGASRGHASALATIDSWGSKSRRTRTERRPDKNGLYWSTYLATVRRHGVYASASAGPIDFNQELCDPMEKEFSPAWQSVMDGSLRLQIAGCEMKVQEVCNKLERALVQGLAQCGMDRSRLASLATAASRNCSTTIKASFQAIRQIASDSQRDLNRSLLPMIEERMSVGYMACQGVPRGTGTFNRMKQAMHNHGSQSIHGMFNESITELLTSIRQLIERIATMISETVTVVRRALEGVYALSWEDQSRGVASVDPQQMEKIRRCRDSLLPELCRIRALQDSAMDLLGIQREELELDLLHVDTLEERQAKRLQEAVEKGELVDVCDMSDDDDFLESLQGLRQTPPAAVNPNVARAAAASVKPEPTSGRVATASTQPFPQPTFPPLSASLPYAAPLPFSRPLPYSYSYSGVPQPPQWGHGYGNGHNFGI